MGLVDSSAGASDSSQPVRNGIRSGIRKREMF